jgi:hypothetical protein
MRVYGAGEGPPCVLRPSVRQSASPLCRFAPIAAPGQPQGLEVYLRAYRRDVARFLAFVDKPLRAVTLGCSEEAFEKTQQQVWQLALEAKIDSADLGRQLQFVHSPALPIAPTLTR